MTLLDPAGATADSGRQTVGQLLDAVVGLAPHRQAERLRELTDDAETVSLVEDLLLAQTRHLGRDVAPLSRLIGELGDTELNVGETLGAWRLVERLASGGMGTVFVAERADQLYRQRVAIKLLRGSADATIGRRMAAERQLLAQLQHPAIARLYDGGTTPAGQPYLVMEYVEGVALDRYCLDQQPDLRARIELFQKVCRAVEAAHRQLVVHCDLKPANVLVQANGEPVLLDFGIARALGAGAEQSDGFCTPAYASPELVAGGAVTTASDVFSLGVLLAELLTGLRPPRSTPEQVIPTPSALAGAQLPWRRQLRGDLDAIAQKAAAIDPARRYPSVAALDEDLSRHLAHWPVRARALTPGYRGRRMLRCRWREATALAVLATLSAGFVWQLDGQRIRAQRSAETSERVSDLMVDAFKAADPKHGGNAGELTARDVLDAGAAKLADAHVEDPAVLAKLRGMLGLAYHNLGHPKLAEPLMVAAIDGYLELAVDQPLPAASLASELAVLRSNGGQDQSAVDAARLSLRLREQAGAAPVDIADSLNSLGLALVDLDNDEAHATLRRALALRREHVGQPSKEVASTLHNLGLLQRHRGDFIGAEGLYREALAQKRALDRTRDGSYGFSLAGLAMSLRGQGRLEEAARLQREILRLAGGLYRDGTNLGDAHNELANTLHDMGEWPEAVGHYAEAERLMAASAGPDSVDYAVSLNNHASLDEDRGALALAEQGFRRSLAIRAAAQGTDSASVLRARFNLGRLLLRQQRLGEAGPLIEQAWAEWQREKPATHPNSAGFRLTYTEWLLASGQLQLAREELQALASAAPELTPKRRAALHALQADMADRSGDPEGGERQRRLALIEMATEYGADHVETAKYRVDLAASLQAIGRLRQARAELDQAHAVLAPRLFPQAPLRERMRSLRAALDAGQQLASR